MASLNINEIYIKQEHGSGDSHTKDIELLFVNSNDTIKHELNDLKYPSIICDGVQVKQEKNDMGNVKPTTAVCNNVLDHVKLEQTDSVEAAGEHFIGECDYCNKMFDCRLSLVKHIHNHIIQESCKTYLFYKNEIKNIESVEPTHVEENSNTLDVCSVCSNCFTKCNCLITHEQTYTKQRPHECNVCYKRFTRRNHLKRHELTHTNERPYTCDVCNKSYTSQDYLKMHKLSHTNNCPYVCNVCSKSFTQSCNLRQHELIHTNERPYVCNLCSKSFTRKDNLRTHKLTHTNERPHVCNVCNKSFTRSDNLRTHKLTHQNKLAHICNVCDKSFRFISSLKYHMRIAHPK